MEYTHGSFKVGTWIATMGGEEATEVDLYTGYNHSFMTEGYSLDFMVTNYTYVQKAKNNSVEYSIGLNTPYLNLFIGQMPEYFGVESASNYISISKDFTLGESGVVLGLGVGSTSFADEDKFSKNEDGYQDYKVSLTKKKDDIEISIFYTENDLEEDEASLLLDDSVVGGSVTVSF